MKFFCKKETLTENISFMALLSAINIILSLIISFQPILSLFLVLILPLTSALVELTCKDRYYPIYAFASIGLSLVATLWNLDITIFYLIPSVITGYFFGLLNKKNVFSLWTILLTSLIQMLFSMLSIIFIYLVYQRYIIDDYLVFFKLADSNNIKHIIPTALFAFSLAQMSLSYFITSEEIKRFGYVTNNNQINNYIYDLTTLIITILIIPFSFFSITLSYFLLALAIYFMTYSIGRFIQDLNVKILVFFGAALLVSIIIFTIFFKQVKSSNGLLLFATLPLLISIISLIASILKKKKDNNKIIQ